METSKKTESPEKLSEDILQSSIKLRMPRLHEFIDDTQKILNSELYEEMNNSFTEKCSICDKITIPELKAIDKESGFLCYDCATDVLANCAVENAVNETLKKELEFRKRVTFSTKLTENIIENNKMNVISINTMENDSDKCMHSEKNNSEETIVNDRNIPIFIGEDISNQYIKGQILGSGKFGKVYKIEHKVNGRHAAAKEIRYIGKESKDEISKEIEILKYLSGNEYILELYEVMDCCHTKRKSMILITEYLDGGDLFNQIANEDLLTESQIVHIMKQILEGVLYMHNKAIIHRDLKPENIMYRSNQINKIKIIDFGFAVRYDQNNPPKSMVGTTIFVAPEVLSYENQCYKTDIWSIGVIAYNLLTGITPFEIPQSGDLERQLTDVEIIKNIQRCQYDFEDEGFIGVSEEAKNFIRLILIRQPKKRLTAGECLKHNWIVKSKKAINEYSRSISIQRMKNYVALRKWEKLRMVIQSLSNFKTVKISP